MPRHRGTARDVNGNALSGASVIVYHEGVKNEASLFSEPTLTTELAQPIITGSNGLYEFWVEDGVYDIQIAATGFATVTLEDTLIGHLFADAYTSVEAAVAQNSSTYTPMGGTWVTGVVTQGGFTHSGGAFTYIADSTERALVNINGSINTSAGSVDVSLAILIDGSPVSGREWDGFQVKSADPTKTIGFQNIIDVEKDCVITIGTKVGAGTPTLTWHLGTTISMFIL